MKFDEYKQNVMVTAPKELSCSPINGHLLHGVMGLVTESAELVDALKKNLAYGKAVDDVNLREELGDAMWYIAYLCETQGWSMDDILEKNIAKLKARFGDKFSQEKALNRNLEAERKILEQVN